MTPVVVGNRLDTLDIQLREHFNAGDRVEMFLGIDKDVSDSELSTIQQYLTDKGVQLTSPLEFGSVDQWNNAIRMTFTRPSYEGVGFVFSAMGLVAATVLGWKITDDIANVMKENFAKIVIIGAIAGVSIYYISRKVPQA